MSILSISSAKMSYKTTGEAARTLGVGLNTIKRWIKNGDLRGVCTPGGHWRIPKEELQRFMSQHGMPMLVKDEVPPVRVLIVDDDPSACALFAGMLEQADFSSEIKCVHDGYSGLVQVGAWKPNVLVLDILMPGINGLEVLRRLRAGPELEDMAILVITATFDQLDVMQSVKAAGVSAILHKPVDRSQFLAAIAACLAPSGSL